MLNLKAASIEPKVTMLLEHVRIWVEARPDVTAVALAGSHAHGRARPDSDVDLVILSDRPDDLRSAERVGAFGEYVDVATEQWGVLTSYRVTYSEYGEVELGVAPSSWSAIPVDPGTHKVVRDGIISVYNPLAALDRLIAEVRKGSRLS